MINLFRIFRSYYCRNFKGARDANSYKQLVGVAYRLIADSTLKHHQCNVCVGNALKTATEFQKELKEYVERSSVHSKLSAMLGRQ